MGSRLRRDLREVLPASIKGLQRAIALEIADDARYDDSWRYSPESGRHSKARLSDLVRWTGAKDELSIREMLRRLAVAGWEFRVPIGTGKDGRPLYAVPGRAMQFRVPDFEGPTVVGPCSDEESEGPTVVGEGPTTVGEGPTVVAEGPTTVGPPSLKPPPTSHRYPTSSSPAGVPPEGPAVTGPVTDGGGGGSLDESRSTAEEIASALDYRGKIPDKRQRKTIADRLTAALTSGWTVDGLAFYLDLGTADVDSPAAVYAHRLKPGVLPDAEPIPASLPARGGVRGQLPTADEIGALTIEDVLGTGRQDTAAGGIWERATARARERMGGGGTDSTLAGWAALSRDLARREPHRPYSDDVWTTPATPAEAAKIPHCGDPDCDEISRMKDCDVGNGLKAVSPCGKCHPATQW